MLITKCGRNNREHTHTHKAEPHRKIKRNVCTQNNKKQAKPTQKIEEKKNDFCWAFLFFLMGIDAEEVGKQEERISELLKMDSEQEN